jgi:thymidylate kinase
MESPREKQIIGLREVFQEFDKQGIQYCILRNYEFLLGDPMSVESVDTVISCNDIQKVDSILHSLKFTKRTQQFSRAHKAYFKFIGTERISFDIQVDGIHWNDMAYLDEEVLSRRVKVQDFYVLSDNDSFIMFLAHSILGKRRFKNKYQRLLSELFLRIDQKIVLQGLSGIFSTNYAQNLLQRVRKKTLPSTPFYNYITLFLLNKPRRILTLGSLSFRWLWQRKNPFKLSPLISVVGPDGAGKSTAVLALSSFLEKNGRKTKTVYSGRGRDNILPIRTLGRKYKSREKKQDVKKKIKQISLKRKLLYTLMAPTYALDLYLRYLTQMLPSRIKGEIVLTDRYGTDIILMKHVPFWFKKFFYSLFPNPTFSIYLYNDSLTLHERRPEEPIEELERQMEIFTKLSYSLTRKTTNELEDHTFLIKKASTTLEKNWYY